MKAYSQDLRERILSAYDSGKPISFIAITFRVGRSSVKRYVVRRRETGEIGRSPIPGRPAHIGPADYPALRAQLAAAPDATLSEHCDTWERNHHVRVSIWAMERAIKRIGWTRKKR